MKFDNRTDDAGVSPVVGVILMVAITVILSAIIATFVLDLGGSVSQNPNAGVTFDQSEAPTQNTSDDDTEYQVTVQLVSLENADSVTASADLDGDGATTSTGESASISTVGNTGTIGADDQSANPELSSGDTVTVTATLDGKTSVIQTYTVEA